MKHDGAIDLLSSLGLVQACVAVTGVSEIAVAFLRGLGLLASPPAPAIGCFRLDRAGQYLLPIAALGVTLPKLASIAMTELEHPAVYSLVQGGSCLVSRKTESGGAALAGLGTVAQSQEALLAIPLRDHARNHSLAVLLLAGTTDALRGFQESQPWSSLLDIFQRLLAQAAWREQTRSAPAAPAQAVRPAAAVARVEEALIGRSIVARRLRADVLAAAESRLSVLVSGETGTGKDHAAWLIHQASARRDKNFVPLNCAAISPELIAAELFGAAKGAYTGADQARRGLVAAADGGTLFLDEIGDMPLALQATLLRLLNEKRYRPLGEVEERGSDFRLICATHRPLPEYVREGKFREDLYFRIRQLSLVVPALRHRRADIPILAEHAIARHNREQHASITGLSADAAALLLKYDFPGNVRELINIMQVACERARDGLVDVGALRGLLDSTLNQPQSPAGSGAAVAATPVALADSVHDGLLSEACDRFEKQVIAQRLSRFKGSRLRTAKSLGIARRTLTYKCKKFGLEDHR